MITLLTDFGWQDGYVGVMKGVIWGINPNVQIVDFSHDIAPQDIDAAAFVLKISYPYFPKDTVHVVVVDPGVGSERQILGVKTEAGYFLAPDNGVLKYIFDELPRCQVISINQRRFFLSEVSQTFHGRDIFAPVAAHLSKGENFYNLGSPTKAFFKGTVWHPTRNKSSIEGRIIYIDRFGNLISNISKRLFDDLTKRRTFVIQVGKWQLEQIIGSFVQGGKEHFLAYFDSSGFLGFSFYGANAQQKTGLKVGEPVRVTVN
ncbi:SAM-dependent chlorinase/fluorinase [bacterium]|nr:SAM-dependent chlorinase/fluorinase [bacterium]